MASDHCELFSMSGEEFTQVVETFPEVRNDLVQTAKERLKELRASDRKVQQQHTLVQTVLEFASRLAKHPIQPTAGVLDKFVTEVMQHGAAASGTDEGRLVGMAPGAAPTAAEASVSRGARRSSIRSVAAWFSTPASDEDCLLYTSPSPRDS